MTTTVTGDFLHSKHTALFSSALALDVEAEDEPRGTCCVIVCVAEALWASLIFLSKLNIHAEVGKTLF